MVVLRGLKECGAAVHVGDGGVRAGPQKKHCHLDMTPPGSIEEGSPAALAHGVDGAPPVGEEAADHLDVAVVRGPDQWIVRPHVGESGVRPPRQEQTDHLPMPAGLVQGGQTCTGNPLVNGGTLGRTPQVDRQ